MGFENLLELLKNVLDRLFEKDLFLIENGIHEQSISHKIACYLEKELKDFLKENGYSIDLEYNKKGKDEDLGGKLFEGMYLDLMKKKTYTIKEKNIELGEENQEGVIILQENDYCLGLGESGNCFIGKIKYNEIEIKSKEIRPDIIVHKRGGNNDGDNLLVFEIKKSKLYYSDILKLRGLTDKNLNFGYKYGVGLSNFDVSKKSCNILIYINGQKYNKFKYKNGKIS